MNKFLHYHDSKLNTLQREIDDKYREMRRLELEMQYILDEQKDYFETHFVASEYDESFRDHINCVEYTQGPYNSIQDILKDLPKVRRIWDLNGKLIFEGISI